MKKDSIFVIFGFLLAFIAGYFIFGQSDAPPEESSTDTTETEEQEAEETDEDADTEDLASTIPEEATALSRNGCLGCHSVESLDAPGGDIGPDLSRAAPEMKGKHGKELDEFLQDPTAAVMATIIADDPLEDDEREQIVKALEKASEKMESDEPSSDESDSDEEDAEDDTSEDEE